MYPLIKEHITSFKYGLLILNIILMIIAVKALVNHQTIIDSIDDVNDTISHTQQHTDYINNFLLPYLKSDYAPYFAAHENNRLFPGDRIIKIVSPLTGDTILLGEEVTATSSLPSRTSEQTPPNAWKKFLLDIFNQSS